MNGQALITLGVLLAYLACVFMFADSLPAMWGKDAQTLLEMMQQGAAGEGSYAATARLLALLPEQVMLTAVAGVGCLFILVAVPTLRGGLANGMFITLLAPLLLMGLLRPQKETVVVFLTMLVTLVVSKLEKPWQALLLVASVYALYGWEVRAYFLLILGVIMALELLQRVKPLVRVVVLIFGLALVLLLPGNVFYELQGSRDSINASRVVGVMGNRTFFTNPFYPDDAFSFLGNYVYAALRLNLPILFNLAPQEIFLSVSMVIYAWVGWLALKLANWRVKFLTRLLLAHALVLFLFEPDLGSYLRHLSSVLLYLWPGFLLWQKQHGRGEAKNSLLPFLKLKKFYA